MDGPLRKEALSEVSCRRHFKRFDALFHFLPPLPPPTTPKVQLLFLQEPISLQSHKKGLAENWKLLKNISWISSVLYGI